jgi:predicted DCC family thiol-disulfide oxidoreductase YuxK
VIQKNNPEKSIILFDGVCNFCNASVNFIIRHNRKESFLFVPLQSSYGKKLLQRFSIRENYSESIVLIEDNKIYFKSTAALRIAKKSDGLLSSLYLFIIIPSFLRDHVYDWIARHRSSWFRNQNNCIVPDERVRKLFREE